jgi:CRP-like cAMP-binding protein
MTGIPWEFRRLPAAAAHRAARLVPAPPLGASEAQIRQAAGVARCVGRGQAAPLRPDDVAALASILAAPVFPPGAVVFSGGRPSGVWIVRSGRVELSVGSGRCHAVIQVLRPGDVDGDIQLLLDMPLPYTGRAVAEVTCLFLARQGFEDLLASHPAIARRWLTSVAQRLAASQARILALRGRSLAAQAASLLAEETVDGRVELPQRTLAAMLGVARPSLNKVLKDLERAGLIRISYAAIEVPDPARLATRARAAGRPPVPVAPPGPPLSWLAPGRREGNKSAREL